MPEALPSHRLKAWLRASTTRTALVTLVQFGTAGGLWLLIAGRPYHPVPGPSLPWWLLAPAFLASETYVLHVQVRREARTISLSDLPLTLGLLFTHPVPLLFARVAGTLTAYLWRRQHPLKMAFNVSLLLLEVGVSVLVSSLLRGPDLDVRTWAAVAAGTATAGVLSAVLVTAIIAVNEELSRLRELPRAMRSGVGMALAVTAPSLLAADALAFDAWSAVLLVALVGLVLLAYRTYAGLSQRHLSLERLYQFTQVVTTTPEIDEMLRALLQQAKELLRAERALVVFPGSSADPRRERWAVVSLDPDDQLVRTSMPAAAPPHPVSSVLDSGSPVLLQRGARDQHARAWLTERGFREAVLAPLRADAGVMGVLLVADRLGEIATFERDDIRLLETVANHSSVALENGRLVEQLRHDALHDGLTGLPNRVHLQRRLRDGAEGLDLGTGVGFAVLLMDLDGFKEVNDTLGHQQGDVLLQEVAARLTKATRRHDLVARLGGDEFALLLPGVTEPKDAMVQAQRLLRALDEPMTLDGTQVQVSGSIGVAVAPVHGTEPAALLKRADIAMYAAKRGGRGALLYDPDLDGTSPTRLALVSELRTAIAEDQLVVYFQPQVRADDCEVVAVEALVRWQHPRDGLLAPDSFIPLAERNGLIESLTTVVLRTAVAQAARWRRERPDLIVAVNLSPRSLLRAGLVDEVAALLAEHRFPAQQLTLEVTESSVLSDPARAVRMLEELAAMGVRLSMDDFGTGYSSLSYLKRLPVHEVKIDKSFVRGICDHPDDMAIVQSIVDLGTNLGLTVVAEGVEDDRTRRTLHAMGCGCVQGYALTPPLPADELQAWLAAHETRTLPQLADAASSPRRAS